MKRALLSSLVLVAAVASMAQLNRVSVNQIIGTLTGSKGGTGSTFFTVTGPTAARTYTFEDATTTVLSKQAAPTNHGVIVGTGAAAVGVTAVGGTGSVLYGQAAADPIWSTLTLPNAAVTGTYLIATGTNALAAVAPALTHSTPANQSGNATATFKMNGLACAITPVATGRVVFMITGQQTNNTSGDGVTIKLAEGTGAAPSNAAAATGTVISATQTWTALTGQLTTQFAIIASATGLALSTAVWFDLQIADVTGGTVTVTNVDCTAHEI
jgi:hypothetical protein